MTTGRSERRGIEEMKMNHFTHNGQAAGAVRARLLLAALVLAAAFAVLTGSANATGSFGVASFATSSSTSQAGAHADFTTSFTLNTDGEGNPAEQVKDVNVKLPVGIAGNPQATAKCTPSSYAAFKCPVAAQVGVLHTTFAFPGGEEAVESSPVYNMTPAAGHVATFSAFITVATIVVQVDVRTDGSYGLEANVENISTLLPIVGSSLTLWGVPADSSHDVQRVGPAPEFVSPIADEEPATPFMINPTNCSGGSLSATVGVDSWQNPGHFVTQSATQTAPTGCDQLHAVPTIAVTPSTTQAGAPAGLEVDLQVPQSPAPYALATPDLSSAVVTLPAGMSVSPSSANGLGACSQEQIGLDNGNVPSCPNSSKIGTLEIDTPLLKVPLTGSVYLAQQGSNPFGSLLALYLVAEGGDVQVKLAGQVTADSATGQLTASFANNPQLPFSELKLDLFGGQDASLVNPSSCGEAKTTSTLAFYGGVQSAPSSAFTVTGCGAAQFSPAFSGGTTSSQAGGFSPLSVTFSRSDQDQGLDTLAVRTPPGLLGMIKTVAQCPEAQAAQGTCGADSLIGHTTVGAGPGSNPFYLGGGVYLTGPYKGTPYGLSIVVPAIAGPFNLGTVVVRAQIAVDPHTAQLTITSDPLPRILQGIPLDLRTVNVTVDRAGFVFNPTNCETLAVTAALTSTQGMSASASTPFQAANCARLAFAPKFSASTSGKKTSRSRGASLNVKLSYGRGQANIGSVLVSLPKQLPSRLATLNHACPAATFAANPASCDPESLVGSAKASTPILSTPLSGPAYLVSHGGAAFPDLVVVLSGQGVRIDLVGNTVIKHGITSTKFAHVPDAPISSFELKLPEGPHSALATNGSLCAKPLVMPTTIKGQNGAVVKQATKIKAGGCAKAAKKHR
jgi:hypothetical protein